MSVLGVPSNGVKSERRGIAFNSLLNDVPVALFFSLLISAPFFFDVQFMPNQEALNLTYFPVAALAKQILAGNVPYWNHGVALGVPWPLPTPMTHTPFTLLFGVLPIYKAVGVVIFFHLFLRVYACLKIAKILGFGKFLSIVCGASAIFASELEYAYWIDAGDVLVAWGLQPLLVLFSMKFWLATSNKERWIWSIVLGGAIGYSILNSHLGFLAIYFIGIALFWLENINQIQKYWRYIFVSVLIAIVISIDKTYTILVELERFPLSVRRLEYDGLGPWFEIIWHSLFKPFYIPTNIFSLSFTEYLNGLIELYKHSYTASFGGIFFLSGCLIAPFYSKKKPFFLSFFLAFIICGLVMSNSGKYLPQLLPGTTFFRDNFNFFGVFLGGMGIQALSQKYSFKLPRLVPVLISLQFFQVFLGSTPYWLGHIVFPQPIFWEFKDIKKIEQCPSLLFTLKVNNDDNNPCSERAQLRILSSSQMFYSSFGKNNTSESGIISSSGILQGFWDVSAIIKGISLHDIQMSQLLPYSYITGQNVENIEGEYTRNWPLEDQPLLTLLGINAVVSLNEQATAERLTLKGTQKLRTGDVIQLWENEDVWPKAVSLTETHLNSEIPTYLNCKEISLICHDFSKFIQQVDVDENPITSNFEGDTINITRDDMSEDSFVLVTSMYRPEWVADNIDVKVTNWHSLLLLQIPKGVNEVSLKYKPWQRVLTRWISLISILLLLCTLLFIRMRKYTWD